MRLLECVNAYLACIQLMEEKTDYETAHAFVMLKLALYPHAAFYAAEEMKLAEKYAQKKEDGTIKWSKDGTFACTDVSAAKAYKEETEKLAACTVTLSDLPFRGKKPAMIRPACLEALQGFIEFEGGEAHAHATTDSGTK